jgi:tetratricopeptide (TPR) repeat protein
MTEPVEETIARLRASVTANPNNPVTRLMLGRAYQQVGRIDEAVSSVQRATTLKTDYYEAFVTLGGLHRQKGDASQAANAFATAVKVKPGATEIWLELAKARSDAGDDAGAADAYAKVIEERADDVEALRDGGLASHRAARHETAETWLSRAIACSPELERDGRVQLALARSAMAAGRVGAAVQGYAKAIAHGAEDAEVRREEAEALVADGRVADAVGSLARAGVLAPQRTDLPRRQGELERDLERLEEARASFLRWTALAPDEAEAFYALGTTLAAIGREVEAIDPLGRAAKLAPSRHDVALAWARALHAGGRTREAVEVLEPRRADAAFPAAGAVQLSDLYRALARARDSRKELEDARTRWPSAAIVHVALAESFVRDDELELAEQSFERAAAIDPADLGVKLRWADTRLVLGKHEAALPLFDALRRVTSAEPELVGAAQRGVGECALALGRPVEALEALEAAVGALGAGAVGAVGAREQLALGLSLMELGRVAEAESALTKAAAAADDRYGARAEAALGDAKARLGKLEEARSAFRRALMLITASGIEDDPDDSRSGESRLSFVVPAAIEEAVRERPSPIAKVDVAMVRAQLASVDLELGRPADALAIADSGLAKSPDQGALHRVRAAALTALGRTREATEALEQALWHAPDDPDLVSAMGTTLSSLGQDEKAMPFLERAVAASPEDEALARTYARACMRTGRTDAGFATYERLARSRRGTAADWLEVAAIEEARGRDAEASDAYREAARKDPERVEGHRGAGRMYRKQGKLEEAMRVLRNAVRLDERDAPTWLELARAQAGLERRDEAVASYRRALELVVGTKESALAHRELGLLLVELHEDREAERVLASAAQLEPEHAETHRVLAAVRARLGGSGAREALESAVAAGDRSVATLMTLAKARLASSDEDGAMGLLRDVAQAAASDATAREAPWMIAQILLRRGVFGDALAWCDRALSAGDESIAVHLGAAEAAIGAGNRARAWVALRRALVLEPGRAEVQRLRGRLAVLEGQWVEAAEAYEKVLLAEPTALDALSGLGRAAEKLGRFAQAERPLEAAMARAPHDHEVLAALGRVRASTGRAAEAIPLLLRAVDALERQGTHRAGQAHHGAFKDAISTLTGAFVSMGAVGDAGGAIARAVAAGAEDAELHRMMGRARSARGEVAEARQSFARAVELAPEDGGARAELGVALAMAGDDSGAIVELAKAHARGALEGRAAFVYGVCLHRQQRLGEAREAYALAVRTGVAEPDCLRALGDTSAATGREREACEAYAQAIVSRPDDADLRVALAISLHRVGRPEEAMDHYRILRSRHAAKAEQLFRVLRGG